MITQAIAGIIVDLSHFMETDEPVATFRTSGGAIEIYDEDGSDAFPKRFIIVERFEGNGEMRPVAEADTFTEAAVVAATFAH